MRAVVHRLRAPVAGLAGTAAVVALILLPMDVASACSCAGSGAREMLHSGDAAFVGRIVREEPLADKHDFYDLVYIFSVKESFKRALGSELRVASPEGGGKCQIYAFEGQDLAYVLYEYEPGRYGTSSCDQLHPDELRAASRPLPRPDGRGPAAFVLGGAFGDVRTISLDASGRTLAYGRGNGEVAEVIPCPGGRRFLERVYEEEGGIGIAIRDLRSLRLLEHMVLPETRGYFGAVGCPDEEAQDVLLFWSDLPYGNRGGFVWQRSGESWRRIPAGRNALLGTFIGRRLYITTDDPDPKLIRLDTETKTRRTIAKVPAQTTDWRESPDGRRLVGITSASPNQTKPRLVMVDLATKPASVVSRLVDGTVRYGIVEWLGDNQLAAFSNRLSFFDASLNLLGRWKREWGAYHPAIVDDRVYGILSWPTRLASVRLNDGGGLSVVSRRLEDGVSTMLVRPEARKVGRPAKGNIPPSLPRATWKLGLIVALTVLVLAVIAWPFCASLVRHVLRRFEP